MNDAKLKDLKAQANKLPLCPGVYIMYSVKNEIIYIGKAKKLKNRVTQYFGSPVNHTVKVRKMVENVDRFEHIICDSELEAFILENSLIKQHQPKYNILLKDDKGYHYIKITDEKWRKICAVKQKTKDGKYIGPYNSGQAVKNTVDETLKIFKLPSCSRSFDKYTKPCLNYHIGICSAPCRNKMSINEYNEQVDSAVAFIKKGGYTEKDFSELTEKMNKAADNLDFEYAAKLRDRINAIKKMSQKQKVVSFTYENQDVFCSIFSDKTVCIQLLKFRGGRLTDQNHYFYDEDIKKSALYYEFLSRFYDNNDDIPPRIIFDELPDDYELLEHWLTDKTGKHLEITAPKIGEQKEIIEMCRTNCAENLAKHIKKNLFETKALDELKNLLGLKKTPEYIESYDISNTAGSENVAAMVVFKGGIPFKDNYRKFKIKTFVGQDDFRSMAEVLDRRFCEYEKGTDVAFKILPDLILLDGAEGQISAVVPILLKHQIEVPLFGMVKDSKHRTRAIASSGGDIYIKSNRSVFTFITKVQDETHRCAISYHKKRRSMSLKKTSLTDISGIGEKRAKALLSHFKSIKNIKSADINDLKAVPGITLNAAENIIKYFKNNKDV